MPSKAIEQLLEQIDWYSFGHAYGDASYVPVWLRQLYSRDKSVRDQTWSEIFGSLRHQGDVYESSILVVDLLREMLFDPKLPAKDEMLQSLAHWTEPAMVAMKLSNYRGRSLAAKLNREVAAGWEDYAKFLESKSAKVRMAAAHALSVCLPHAEQAADRLKNAIKAERSGAVRAEMLVRLATVSQPSDLRLFKRHASDKEANGLARLAATWSWLIVDRGQFAPKAAIKGLEETPLPTHRGFLAKYRHEPIIHDTSRGLARQDVLTPLCLKLIKSREIRTKEWAISHLAASGSETALQGIEACLNDENEEVRSFTAFIVGDAKMKRAVKPLGDLLLKEPKQEVRATVLRALKKLIVHAGPAMDGIAHVAANDDSNSMRTQALDLESLFDQIYLTNDIERLVAWLDVFENPELAKVALRRIKQLAKDSSESIAQTAIKRLESAFPALVRQWALALKHLQPLKPKTRKALLAVLRPQLQAKQLLTRIDVGDAIRAIEGKDPQPAPTAAELKEEIANKTGETPKPKLVQLLRQVLNDRSSGQEMALWELRKWGPRAKAAMPYLQATLKKPRLRAAAAGTIAWISPVRGKKFVTEMLSAYQQVARDADALRNAHVFTQYMPPQLQPQAVEHMLNCLPDYVVAPDHAAMSMVYAIHNFYQPDPEVMMPLIQRLLTLAWPREYRGLGSPVARVLHFLKTHGHPYRPMAPYVGPWLEDPVLQTLALETLSRIGDWEDAEPFIDEAELDDTPDNRRYLARLEDK